MASAGRARARVTCRPKATPETAALYYFNLPISVGPVIALSSGLTTLNDARMKVTVRFEPDAISTSRPLSRIYFSFYPKQNTRLARLYV